ncbi:cancer-associated gene 1 protein isoform X7 [Muntiacus reevesi]|uniref:cancer-associated gene 1 protein isoform X7 n=1 Tax=Muntiacus reevesi TaxID=9886 RepID=UPI003306F057
MDPGNVNIGNYSQNVLTQPIDTSISSLRKFEPLCQFHQTESFNNEIAVQDLTESLSYTEEPELQHYVCDYAEDTNIQEDSFKEENPMGTSTFTHTDHFALECVRQPSRSPPLIHCSEETLKFMEMPLANSNATESALNPSQSQDFLCEEEVPSDVEQPFYKENLRANYGTEEIAGSSKGVQNSMDIPEMSVRHQKEVPEKGRWSSQMVSTWAPAGICWSGGPSQEACMTPDTEQSLESLQPLEEDMALNEVLRKLKCTNKEQETRIHDLERRNSYLEKKVEELQMTTTKQHVFVDIINKLKEKIEELIEEKYRIKLEKSDTEKTLQGVHEILVTTQHHLQEYQSEKETLQLEFKKLKGNYVSLQERYMTQCMEMDSALSRKEEETERLQQLKGELEKATVAALDLLQRQREAREQEFLSLREEFQKCEREHLDEREKLKSKLEKLVAQVQNVQFLSDSEKAKNAELQQQINEVKNENTKLQQQVARSEEQNCVPKCEIAQLKDNLEDVIESDVAKDAKMTHSNLSPNHSPREEGSANPPDMKRTSQPTSRSLSLLDLMVELLPQQESEHIGSEHKYVSSQATEFDSKEAKNVRDVPVVLGARLNQYHSLNEELDFLIEKLENLLETKEDHCNRLTEENDKYQRQLGNLINKVTSYEEIIKCADQRLVISHSRIAHLEERNKQLEDLIRRSRERVRRPRPRSQLKLLAVMPVILEGNRNDLD